MLKIIVFRLQNFVNGNLNGFKIIWLDQQNKNNEKKIPIFY